MENASSQVGELQKLRIVFMGTPAYALGSLNALAAADFIDVVLVVTRPDAASRRGKALVPSEVKARALELGLPVLETKSLRKPDVQEQLRELAPDALCVTAYGAIIPDEVLDIPRLGSLNVHASLLPRWRGAAPMQRALLEGDERLGFSVMRIVSELDAGAWCTQGSVEVTGRTYAEVSGELSRLGGEALVDALRLWAAGEEPVWHEQDESQVTYAEKLSKAELALSPEVSALTNMHRVQASSDEAPARCVVAGRGVRVTKAHVADKGALPAELEDALAQQGSAVINAKHVYLACSEGALELDSVRPDGKREMPASAFAAGIHDPAPLTWEAIL